MMEEKRTYKAFDNNNNNILTVWAHNNNSEMMPILHINIHTYKSI